MNYPSSSNNNINNLRPSHTPGSSSVPQRREQNVLESTSKEPNPTPRPNQMDESLSQHMRMPSESELQGRSYPHSTIVKVKVEILQSKEDSKQKKSNSKVLIQVEADRLIQKQLELLNSNEGDLELQKQLKSKEKEKAVDYVDWKEGDEFVSDLPFGENHLTSLDWELTDIFLTLDFAIFSGSLETFYFLSRCSTFELNHQFLSNFKHGFHDCFH